jgi:Ti-type conjugative transfer relaxase TraA
MAIYHFSGTVVSRGSGKSAIASAAYRAGEKLYDERQDRISDYSRKQDVVYKEIMLPEGAPDWMADREKLWNAVERQENRKDSQLAREFNFALPKELSSAQNIQLAKEFVQKEFVAKGMVADLCIHDGKTKDGEEQPHAHVMLSMRRVTEKGFAEKKDRSWNDRNHMPKWREAWADYANKCLEKNGIDQKIDHRTLEEQGIDLEAQKKIGPESMRMQRIRELRVEEHQRIAKENGDKILEDPNIALKAVTYHHSTFSHKDLAKFINRHTIDADQFQMVYEKVKASEQIVSLGKGGIERRGMESGIERNISEDNRGIERGIERFTTKEMLFLESKMLDDAMVLKETAHIAPRSAGSVESKLIDKSNDALGPQQKDALEHIVGAGDIKCLVGYAGTGKSHLLAQAREIWEKDGYIVHGATLSGIAAEGLEAASGIESRTLASRCYYWNKGEEKLAKKDVLVIDEAGMLGSRQVARVLEEVREAGAKAVLLGDPQQLQSIEAGAAFRAISEQVGFLELTEIRRQREPWQQEATKEFALQNTKKALDLYEKNDHVHLFETQAIARKSLVEMWNEDRATNPYKTQIMLAYTRRDAQELNNMARSIREENYEFVGDNQKLQTSGGEKTFAIGERIYFLQNDRFLGVKNGTLGTIEGIEGKQITVSLDREGNKDSSKGSYDAKRVTFDLDQYNHITHGYAATIHKAQGVTVDKSYVLASKHLDSHATYVGMSRHRESADLFCSKEEFANRRDFEKALGRDRSKDVTLDYIGAQRNPSRIEIEPDVTKPFTVNDIKAYKEALRRDHARRDGRPLREKTKSIGFEKSETAKTVKTEKEATPEDQKNRGEKLVDTYYKLEEEYKGIKERGRSKSSELLAKSDMTRCARKIYKNEHAMNFLQKNDKEKFKEMNVMKERERSREMEKEKVREKGFELSL